jgi:hypothetical protein
MPMNLDPKLLDFKVVPENMFATKERLRAEHVDETAEALFAGLFAPYSGSKKNYPIVRHGKLAMISDERLPWTRTETEDLYLVDVMSFGGNSGSPVFLRLGGSTDSGLIAGTHYLLLGVMQGYFGVESPVTVNTAELKGEARENTGVAAVVPAQKILDILQGPRAKAYIDRLVAKTYIARGDLKGADDLYRGVMASLVEYDPEDVDLKVAKLEYAELLRKMGRFVDASVQQSEAQRIRRAAPVPDNEKK